MTHTGRVLALFILIAGLGFIVAGCVMQPARVAYPPPPPVVVQPPVVQEEPEELLVYDYVGDTTPIVVAAYPGVLFYPRYIGDAIVPVGFVNGVWINGFSREVVVVPRGGWRQPPDHVIRAHREEARRNPDRYRRVNVPDRHPGQPQHRPEAGPQNRGPQNPTAQSQDNQKKGSTAQQHQGQQGQQQGKQGQQGQQQQHQGQQPQHQTQQHQQQKKCTDEQIRKNACK